MPFILWVDETVLGVMASWQNEIAPGTQELGKLKMKQAHPKIRLFIACLSIS
jgi:hypothetical protein